MVGLGTNNLPSQLAQVFIGPPPPEGTNIAGISNSEYEDLVTRALNESGDESCTLWNEAEIALLRNLDAIQELFKFAITTVEGISAISGKLQRSSLMNVEDDIRKADGLTAMPAYAEPRYDLQGCPHQSPVLRSSRGGSRTS